MTRKKVKLMWIANDSARKASLNKRRVGLLKKVSELSTLCGVSAFIVIYGPDDNEPAVWPSRLAVRQILARFQSLPEMDRCKKTINQEGYLKERLNKVQEQLRKHQIKSRQTETSHLMYQMDRGKSLDDFSTIELHGLIWFVEMKLKDFRERAYYLQQVSLPSVQAPPPISSLNASSLRPPHRSTETETTQYVSGGGGQTTDQTLMMGADQWFIDLMNNSDSRAGGSSSIRSNVPSVVLNHPFVGGGFMGETDFRFPNMNQIPNHYSYVGSSVGANHQTGFGHESFMLPTNMNDVVYTNWAGVGGVNEVGLELLGHGGGGSGADVGTGGEVGLPFGFFGGGNSGGAGGDMGFPYNVNKTWPNQYLP